MDEIYLTELEVEIMSSFVRRKILKDEDVVHDLRILIEKLKSTKTDD